MDISNSIFIFLRLRIIHKYMQTHSPPPTGPTEPIFFIIYDVPLRPIYTNQHFNITTRDFAFIYEDLYDSIPDSREQWL